MMCKHCGSDPCICAKPTEQTLRKEFEYYECGLLSCHTVIRMPKGAANPGLCQWHRWCEPVPARPFVPGFARPTDLRDYDAAPGAISQAEFGLALFETIKTIGGIMAVNEHLTKAAIGGTKAQKHHWQTRKKELIGRLAPQVKALSDDDAKAITDRYPWVLAL